jgi:hypothetical protein
MDDDLFRVQDESGKEEPYRFVSFDQALSHAYGVSWVESRVMFVAGRDSEGRVDRIAKIQAVRDVSDFA